MASSKRFCNSALEAFQNRDRELFLLHSAVSLEHLAKALLASLHPALLVEDRDFDSLLHAAGQSRHARRSPERAKSIPMDEALRRCGQLVPPIQRLDDELRLLRQIRNGIVHLGLVTEEGDELLIPYLQSMELLLAEMQQGAGFFGGHARWVEEQLQEAKASRERDVLDRIAASKRDFANKFKGMEPAWKADVLRMTVASYEPDEFMAYLRECPACGTQALLTGDVVPDYEVDFEWEDGEAVPYPYRKSVDFYAEKLVCKACGLVLSDGDFEAAGVDGQWTLEDVDEELLRDWEMEQERRWSDYI